MFSFTQALWMLLNQERGETQTGPAHKYNPHHYPKGPRGGQFAPKSLQGGSGWNDIISVPYRGTKIHQGLVARGLAKPWERKATDGGSGISAAEKADFKDVSSARAWVAKNLAHKMYFGDRSLQQLNDMLGPIKRIVENGNLPKVKLLSLSQNLSEVGSGMANGVFIHGSDVIAISKNVGFKAKDLERHIKMCENLIKHYKQHGREVPSSLTNRLKEARHPSLRSDTWSVSSTHGGAAATLVHEFGHAWHDKNKAVVEKELGLKWSNEKPSTKLETTQYSRTNHKEAFAEGFAAYMFGHTKKMAPEMVKFFDKQFPKLNHGGTA